MPQKMISKLNCLYDKAQKVDVDSTFQGIGNHMAQAHTISLNISHIIVCGIHLNSSGNNQTR